MGQAFDDSGKPLGEAFGTTKLEVFNELIQKFPDAHEIRVRTLKDDDAPQIELPHYRSHKEVWALKISRHIRPAVRGVGDGSAEITPADPRYAPFTVAAPWLRERFKGSDKDPGYYVRYADGYESWSPAEAFESGYTRL